MYTNPRIAWDSQGHTNLQVRKLGMGSGVGCTCSQLGLLNNVHAQAARWHPPTPPPPPNAMCTVALLYPQVLGGGGGRGRLHYRAKNQLGRQLEEGCASAVLWRLDKSCSFWNYSTASRIKCWRTGSSRGAKYVCNQWSRGKRRTAIWRHEEPIAVAEQEAESAAPIVVRDDVRVI